jgi:hypothetical protein
MLSPFIMKKTSKKPLVLTRETLRTLSRADLTAIVGGVGSSVGNTAHPYTCGCPVLDE